jgi:hypothetical protein
MEELVVTRFWMAGVVGMMLVFGVIALIGWFKQSGKNSEE